MTEFLDAILAFPTVLFTVPLGVLLVYWLFVIAGILDVDILDLDGLLEGGSEAALEAADGIGEGVGEGGGDGADGNSATSGGLLQLLGLSGVPLTISLTTLTFVGWMASYLGMDAIEGGSKATWAAILVGAGALGLGLGAAALSARPLRKMLVSHLAPKRQAFVGELCTVTTLRVDLEFGQAEIEDGGAGLLVPIRCLEANVLTRGSKALIFKYDAHKETYLVTPVAEALT